MQQEKRKYLLKKPGIYYTISKKPNSPTYFLQHATAGTMESSDAYVEIEPNENGLEIRLESVVLQQFGQDIEQSVQAVLLRYGVKDAKVTLIDRGALDCVIRARVETAIRRGRGESA